MPTLRVRVWALAIAGCFALLLIPIARGLSPTADDLGAYHLPLRAVYQQALQSGQIWEWNPALLGGFNVHGEGQLGGDHPWHQALYRALPLYWAFGLEWWLPYPLLFFGTWWWLRTLRFGRREAVFGATALALCGFMTLRNVHLNATQVLAHLPWLLGAEERYRAARRADRSWRGRAGWGCAIGLLTASQLLLGYPQYVVYTAIVETIVWVFAACESAPARSLRSRFYEFLGFSGYKIVGVLLAAAQVWPTWCYLATSERSDWSGDALEQGVWHPWNVTQFFAPYLFESRVVGQNTHELSAYCGIITLLAALIGTFSRPTGRRTIRLRSTALTLIVVGFFLASGTCGALALQSRLPLFEKFRIPARAIVLADLGIVLLATLGIRNALRAARCGTIGHTLRSRILVYGLILICCGVPTIVAATRSPWLAPGLLPWIGPALLAVAIGAIGVMLRAPRYGYALTLLVLAADLIAYAATAPTLSRWETIAAPTWLAETWRERATTPFAGWGRRILAHDPHDDSPLAGNGALLYHPRTSFVEPRHAALIDGYVGVAPRRVLDYSQADPAALCAAGVAPVPHDASSSWRPLRRGELFESVEFATPVSIPVSARVLPDSLDTTSGIHALLDVPGRLIFETHAPRALCLTTTESYAPGWIACVDGRRVPVLRVNGDFLGCAVPANTQRVEFLFDDQTHHRGRIVSWCALVLTGGWWFASRSRRPLPAAPTRRIATPRVRPPDEHPA